MYCFTSLSFEVVRFTTKAASVNAICNGEQNSPSIAPPKNTFINKKSRQCKIKKN